MSSQPNTESMQNYLVGYAEAQFTSAEIIGSTAQSYIRQIAALAFTLLWL